MNIQHAVFNHVQLGPRHTTNGLLLETAFREKEQDPEAGMQSRLVLQVAAHIRRLQSQVQTMNLHHVVLQAAQQAQKPMVPGQHLDPASKVNVLAHAHGQQYKQILQVAAQQPQQK